MKPTTTTATKTPVQTIDVDVMEWFDRVNGNSYFAGAITVNYGMDDQRTYTMPFQYGYGDHYKEVARIELEKFGEIIDSNMNTLWSYCQENKIILRNNKESGCKKRYLKVIG